MCRDCLFTLLKILTTLDAKTFLSLLLLPMKHTIHSRSNVFITRTVHQIPKLYSSVFVSVRELFAHNPTTNTNKASTSVKVRRFVDVLNR